MSHWTEELFVEQADHYVADLKRNVDQAETEVDDILDLLDDEHGRDPDSALDVACGVGRHALPLADRGPDVDGVDVSPTFVDYARDRAADADLADRTRFVEGDMRDLDAADVRSSYDLVTCFFTSFGYFDDETNREVLAGMADLAQPGGAVVVEVTNKELILSDFPTSEAFEFGGYHITERREYDIERSRIETTRLMFAETDDEREYEFAAEGRLSIRLYSPVELRKLFEDVGLDPYLYGGSDGEELTRRSQRQFVVGLA